MSVFYEVVCCQVEVSEKVLFLVQKSPSDCAVSNYVLHRNLNNEEAKAQVGLLRNRK